MGGNLVETLIGAAVLAVAAMFLAFGYSSSTVGRDGGFILTAKFDRVDGLVTGSDVRMSGIKIGTVVDQKLDPVTYQAVIEMDIDPDVKLPDDSSAKITSEGLLGATYMSIEVGSGEDLLQNGGEIRYTQGSVDLMGLIGQAIFSASGKTEEKK
ncbi:MAG: outer membrane lipid asymmetry maintenance protein MlaD [Pseudomonadota bacterium]